MKTHTIQGSFNTDSHDVFVSSIDSRKYIYKCAARPTFIRYPVVSYGENITADGALVESAIGKLAWGFTVHVYLSWRLCIFSASNDGRGRFLVLNIYLHSL